MPARIRIEKSDNISKQRMDWLGCHGNTWAPVMVMPGTCEACTWGERYQHSCERGRNAARLQQQIDEMTRPVHPLYAEMACRVIG